MFILWRYIVREHIGPFFFGLSVIVLIFLLNLVFRELGQILSRGLEVGVIIEFFYLNLAWIFALAIPMAVLMAALMAFGRLSADSEIIALKASGVNMYHLIAPVLFVALLLDIFLVWFNNSILPEFNHRARLLASDIARKRPTLTLEPGVLYQEIKNFNLMVHEVKEKGDTSYVKNVFVEDDSDPKLNKVILADHGKVFFNPKTGMLVLILYDGEMHQLDLETMEQYRRIFFPKHIVSISIPDMVLQRSDSGYRGDREKSAQTMLAEVRINNESIDDRNERIQQFVKAQAIKYLPRTNEMSSDTEYRGIQRPSPFTDRYNKTDPRSTFKRNINTAINDHQKLVQQIRNEKNIISQLERSNYILMVEVQKKYSIPAACLVFILIGAPLGIMARKGGLAVGGSISLGFFLLYWVFLIAGEELADNQIITPFMAMWLANIIVGAAGIFLVIRSIKETTFIHWEKLPQIFVAITKKFRIRK